MLHNSFSLSFVQGQGQMFMSMSYQICSVFPEMLKEVLCYYYKNIRGIMKSLSKDGHTIAA